MVSGTEHSQPGIQVTKGRSRYDVPVEERVGLLKKSRALHLAVSPLSLSLLRRLLDSPWGRLGTLVLDEG